MQLHAEANYIAVMREGALRQQEVPRGFELRSLDSESRVLTVTPRDQIMYSTVSQALPMSSGQVRRLSARAFGSGWLVSAVGLVP